MILRVCIYMPYRVHISTCQEIMLRNLCAGECYGKLWCAHVQGTYVVRVGIVEQFLTLNSSIFQVSQRQRDCADAAEHLSFVCPIVHRYTIMLTFTNLGFFMHK